METGLRSGVCSILELGPFTDHIEGEGLVPR